MKTVKMGDELITVKCLIIVLFLQFLEAFSYNLQPIDKHEFQVPAITIGGYPESKLQVIEYSNAANNYNELTPDYDNDDSDAKKSDQSSLDTWSVIWYIASFGGLILFFLIVSCSEWCCRRNARRNCQRTNTTENSQTQIIVDTPPPSYDQFAPPSYEDLWVGSSRGPRGEKSEYDIYVVPVHALGTIMDEARREEAPPSYQSASVELSLSNEVPRVHSPSAPS